MPHRSPTWTGKFKDLPNYVFYASLVGQPNNVSRCEFIAYDEEHKMLSYHTGDSTMCVHISQLVIRVDKAKTVAESTIPETDSITETHESRMEELEEIDDEDELDNLDDLGDEVMPTTTIGTEPKPKKSAKDLIREKKKGKKGNK